MAYTPKNPKKTNKSSNAYKQGKLSRSERFTHKKFNPVPLIVIGCLLLSFVGAVILGNYLGDKAEGSQNTTTKPGGASSLTPPTADKTDPKVSINAYLADMTGADPEVSLSVQTESARDRGNALFIPLRDGDGKLIYSSDRSEELSYPSCKNLTLERLNNHLDYYVDFAVGYFESDFSAKLDPADRMKTQADEVILLSEATDGVLGQIIVKFDDEINKDDLIYYQVYLLDLKLACPGIPVGIELPYELLVDPSSSGLVADLLSIADFYATDLADADADALDEMLSKLVYLNERYGSVIMLRDGEDISDRLTAVMDKKIKNYIVR